jgi:hypothetical protein
VIFKGMVNEIRTEKKKFIFNIIRPSQRFIRMGSGVEGGGLSAGRCFVTSTKRNLHVTTLVNLSCVIYQHK